MDITLEIAWYLQLCHERLKAKKKWKLLRKRM